MRCGLSPIYKVWGLARALPTLTTEGAGVWVGFGGCRRCVLDVALSLAKAKTVVFAAQTCLAKAKTVVHDTPAARGLAATFVFSAPEALGLEKTTGFVVGRRSETPATNAGGIAGPSEMANTAVCSIFHPGKKPRLRTFSPFLPGLASCRLRQCPGFQRDCVSTSCVILSGAQHFLQKCWAQSKDH